MALPALVPLFGSKLAARLATASAATTLMKGTNKLMAPKIPKAPAVPTIDDAAQQRNETDRIRRRRGALANVAAGANASAPTVGTRTLLGAAA